MFSNKKLISVIMSVYNESVDEIIKSTNSIINQTYQNIEFIIIIDNPNNHEVNDYLFDLSNKNSKIKLFFNDSNKGLVWSLNFALTKVQGDYIARMDADDISFLDRLIEQKKYLEENNLDLIGSNVKIINEDNIDIGIMVPPTKQLDKAVLFKTIAFHPTWFGKIEVFKKLKGYRDLKHVEDYDFLLRAIKLGFKVSNIKKELLYYRVRSNSISNRFFISQIKNSRQLQKLYKHKDFSNNIKLICSSDNNSLITSLLFHEITKNIKKRNLFNSLKYIASAFLIEPYIVVYLTRQLYAKYKFK
ncbi:glycosyltransferase [Providencia manganoxydans]|uniref:glycosyltransferase n=1 Tax=Providencia TaxID=586 RepID=UPI0034E492BB